MKAGSRFRTAVWLLLALVAVVIVSAALVLVGRAGLRVVEVSPREGATGVPITAPVYLVFSQPMDTTAVEDRLRLDPDTPGRWAWQDRTVTFLPQSALIPGQDYALVLEAGAASHKGATLDQTLSWQFQTRAPQLLYLGRPAQVAELRQLYLAPGDGELPRQLTSHAQGVWDYAVHPQGEAIVYSALREDGGSDVWHMNRDGAGQRLLLPCPDAACLGLAWSPDGRYLAYERRQVDSGAANFDAKAARLWLLDLEKDAERPLFDYDVAAHAPAWGPDGQRLAYISPLLPGLEVYHLAMDELQQFDNQWGAAPEWSPDGRRLVAPELMLAGESMVVHLIRMELHDESMVDITGDHDAGILAVKDDSPAWSPGGGWIAFGRQYLDEERWTPGRQIWLTRPDGSEAYPLSQEPMADHYAFAWRPDGAALAYARTDLTQGNQPVPSVSVWVFDLVERQQIRLADDAVLPQWLP